MDSDRNIIFIKTNISFSFRLFGNAKLAGRPLKLAGELMGNGGEWLFWGIWDKEH